MSRHPLVTALIERRRQLGKTQREVARTANLSGATVCEVESGKVGPRLASFVQMADALGCDVVLVPRGRLTKQYGLVFDDDLADVRQSQHVDPVAAEAWVRQRAADAGGAVAVREATPWRLETPQEKS